MKSGEHDFCCGGCKTVFELLQENGLSDFYRLADRPGVRAAAGGDGNRYAVLDEVAVRDRLLEFSDDRLARVTFEVPAIHCVACVWLLENLYKLHAAIGRSLVNFEQKRVTISYDPRELPLSGVAALLAGIGYPPTLRLDSVAEGQSAAPATPRSLYLKLGIAGFAFGNIMLLSVCEYAGMDRFSASMFKPLFGWVAMALALPVLVYSASGYWHSAWLGLRQKAFTIELPIALGLLALFGQSLYEVVGGRGVGYLDSLTGLVFFLLVGRVFQDRTYKRLSFDRDYRAFFPLSVRRIEASGEQTVLLSALGVGDRLRLRHGELIPADARVVSGEALVDYSFVTGESDPVKRGVDERVHAGGQQVGGAVELEILKPVSQSYLTSLWSHEAFQKDRDRTLDGLLNRFSRWFTLAVVAIAVAAAVWWWPQDSARAIRAFTAVLIVACPCALALSVPFALGTAQRLLARMNVFVRNTRVLESLVGIHSIVFDKTGTLTKRGHADVRFEGEPLSAQERAWVRSVALQSMHPQAARVVSALEPSTPCSVGDFQEQPGRGIRAAVAGRSIVLGSAAWLHERGVADIPGDDAGESAVYVGIDSRCRGRFLVSASLRAEVPKMISRLSRSYPLVLLSGDSDRDRPAFESLLGADATLRFRLSPQDKLDAVAALQGDGGPVMMVGDGLNDAGALRQSDVGMAVVDEVGAFSPASDIILEAERVPAIPSILQFARRSVGVVWGCILISVLYNLVGITFASTGRLSPVVCAILMPLSSVTVVATACLGVALAARFSQLKLQPTNPTRS